MMEEWVTVTSHLWRMAPCFNRFRFWPVLVSLVIAIIMLQILHIALLSRLEAKEAHMSNRGPFVGGRQLQGRMFNNVMSEMEDRVRSSFRLDKSGTYHLLDNFLASEHVVLDKNFHDVSIVTQCSSGNLHHLVGLAERWSGPISVSVFTFDDDFIHTVSKILHLHFCHSHVYRHVSFHLVFPISRAPKHFEDMSRNIKLHCATESNAKSSSSSSSFLSSRFNNNNSDNKSSIISNMNYNRKDVEYPVNLLRNLAINYVQTSYIFMVDIDLMPSSNLRQAFRAFMSSRDASGPNTNANANINAHNNGGNTNTNLSPENLDAFVVPVFEMQIQTPSSSKSSLTSSLLSHSSSSPSSWDIPKNKGDLLKAWTKGTVRPFYWEPCEKCQRPTGYQTWRLMTSRTDGGGGLGTLGIAYTVERVDPWEPFYIAKTSVPLYDERFKQYGFNRISQVCEMHVAGYKFHVLDNAFLVHKGFKVKDKFHSRKDEENDRSRILYRKFKEELKVRYPDVSRRC